MGGKKPNPFGLYDVRGNVYEWVEDCWHETCEGSPRDGSAWLEDGDCGQRVARGGDFFVLPGGYRSAVRFFNNVENIAYGIGFRLAQDLDED